MYRFYKQTTYNGDTLNQMWMSLIADSHDIHCKCEAPFAHLLQSIFPPGHKDRQLTIEQITTRDFLQCHSGGIEEESHGIQLGESAATLKQEEEENQGAEQDIDDLILAAAAAAEEGTR